ncbi:hypothetical protein C2G38_2218531 [Gigaspora rosea]|uniref:Uncharacterized protein n=1 Tax=Gigaspora rosea TaxID=44941 RepID=A0A397UEX6_9GLOM|nr:hypothetical protein C2G38_2218531 [Gigaspora rosea]
MDSDHNKRPSAEMIKFQIEYWLSEIDSLIENEIKEQFLIADKIIDSSLINVSKHPDHMYTSKIIDTQQITSKVQEKRQEIAISDCSVSSSIREKSNFGVRPRAEVWDSYTVDEKNEN